MIRQLEQWDSCKTCTDRYDCTAKQCHYEGAHEMFDALLRYIEEEMFYRVLQTKNADPANVQLSDHYHLIPKDDWEALKRS